MYRTWRPEAFIYCLTWQDRYPLAAARNRLQHFFVSFSFSGMCQGWTERAWVVSGLYELLSRMDVYFLAATLDLLTSTGDRFLQDKDRDGGRRLVSKKERK